MRAAVFGFLVLLAVPALAKSKYEPYEARASIFVGQGGTRVTKDGIDFWTTGTPPRRYQLLGIVRDNRGTGRFHGKAIGSTNIAKMVKEAGGDAAVLISEKSAVTGVMSSENTSFYGNQAYGDGLAVPIQEKTTILAVIKYLPD